VDRIQKEHCTGSPKTSSFYRDLQIRSVLENWVVIHFQKLGCVNNSSHMLSWGVLGLEWSDWDCYFS
jgi:hypothetical protein